MNTRETRVAGIINALVNPLLMCSFLPIIEGKAALDLSSPTGFWGQLALAVVIAEVVSSLPQFGRVVGDWVDFFGFKPGGPASKIAGTVFAATLLFLIIGLAEIAFQTGFGLVGETTYFSRWAKLATGGWAFVVVGGLLFDPIAAKIAHVLVGEKTSQIEEVLEAE